MQLYSFFILFWYVMRETYNITCIINFQLCYLPIAIYNMQLKLVDWNKTCIFEQGVIGIKSKNKVFLLGIWSGSWRIVLQSFQLSRVRDCAVRVMIMSTWTFLWHDIAHENLCSAYHGISQVSGKLCSLVEASERRTTKVGTN